MKLVGLISGGKDSVFNLYHCTLQGHTPIVLANLFPPASVSDGEMDSFMFQTAGFDAIETIAEAMQLPLIRRPISGKPVRQELVYEPTEEDEVEDLFALLQDVKTAYPEVQGVAVGAILSDYQRLRVEAVCSRLGLTAFAYLWQADQSSLLHSMISSGMTAVLAKVASMGLDLRHVGKSIAQLLPLFDKLHSQYGFNVCGEGGEYETLTLDSPLHKKRIEIIDSEKILHSDDAFAPVGLLKTNKMELCEKEADLRYEPTAFSLRTEAFKPVLDLKSSQEDLIQTHPTVTQKPLIPSTVETSASSLMSSPYFRYEDSIMVSGLSVTDLGKASSDFESTAHELEALLDHIKELLATQLKSSFADAYLIQLYVKDMMDFVSVNKIYSRYFGSSPASRVCVEVPLETSRVRVTCYLTNGIRKALHVQSISYWAPACIGPYSQANDVDGFIYNAGQIGLEPASMRMVSGGIVCELDRCFQSSANVLTVMKSSLSDLIGCTVYFTRDQDAALIKRMCELIFQDAFFNSNYKKRIRLGSLGEELEEEDEEQLAQHKAEARLHAVSTYSIPIALVQVSALPRGALVELEMVTRSDMNRGLNWESSAEEGLQSNAHTGVNLSRSGSWVNSIYLWGNCSAGVESEVVSVHQVMSAIMSQVIDLLRKSSVDPRYISHMRVMYLAPLDEETVRAAFHSALAAVPSCRPAVTFLPVASFLPSADCVCIQFSTYDPLRLDTQLWLTRAKEKIKTKAFRNFEDGTSDFLYGVSHY